MDQIAYLHLLAGEKEVDSWTRIMLLYNSALEEINTKIAILNEEFKQTHRYNPIEYVKKRRKSPESIAKKLKRMGYEDNIENMVTYCNDIAGIRIVCSCNDIAGIRIVCSFTSDIYRLADMIGRQSDITVLSIKDYIKHPKVSGYKSYHMIVTIPIFLSDNVVDTKVEIQIRTIAMDFWASLEHKIYYKFEGDAPEYISHDLRECSHIVSMEAIMREKKRQSDEMTVEQGAHQRLETLLNAKSNSKS